MARVTLIRPPTILSRWAHTTPTCPPIGLAYLASSLRDAGHSVQVIDAVGEDIFKITPIDGAPSHLSHGLTFDAILARVDPTTDLIGLSCMFTNEWPQARRLIARLRRDHARVPIVGGGEHFTAMPEESLDRSPGLDVCVMGEGEETIQEPVAVLTGGGRPLDAVAGIALRAHQAVTRTPARARIRNVDDIPTPDWSSIPLANYLDHGFGFGVNRGRSMPLIATRGCPYECTFCSSPTMWTTRWVARDPERVIAEMKEYIEQFGAQNFDFYDLTAVVRKDWILRFAALLDQEGLDITWQLPSGTRSEAIDEDTARAMYRSGCRNLSYAPESGSPAVLTRIKKKVDLQRMVRSMRSSIRHGLNIKANIILGFPGETHREVFETLGFLARMAMAGVHDLSISPFSPYPGCELFDELRKSGRVGTLDDEYCWTLMSYTDLSTSVSYSEHVSDRALSTYRLTGMALFYVVCYLARPLRLLRTMRNLLTKQHESRLEMSLHDLAMRLGHRP